MRRLRVLEGVLPIRASQIPREIGAGVTLAAIAIPEVMGYARIAGTPVITGLYTILIPAVFYVVLGSSRHLVVGADSATAAILAAGLVGLAAVGSDAYVALAAVLALMAAGLLLLARAVRLGFMADFLSRTVLVGFLTGVGIQVALGQVSGMLGLKEDGHGALGQLWADLHRLRAVNLYSLAIALVVLAIVAGSKAISRRIPGALVAVAGSIVASWGLGLGRHLDVLGRVPSGLPNLSLPSVDWSLRLMQRLLPTAFAMFVVILAQSAATARAYAARYEERFDENTDLVGLGIANVGAALSGTFVVNGSPTKTQLVDGAGGRTQLALFFCTLVVLAVLLFLTPPLAFMPEAVLSAVVFLVGIDLIDLRGLRDIHRQRRFEFWIAIVTASTVVIVGVEEGILLAIVLALVGHTRHGYRPKNSVLVRDTAGAWRAHPVATGAQALPGLTIYRFTHSMYYANSQQLTEELTGLVRRAAPALRWLCIDAAAVDDIDYSAAQALRALSRLLTERGVRLVVAGIMSDVAAERRSQFQRLFGDDAFYDSLEDVLKDYRRSILADFPA